MQNKRIYRLSMTAVYGGNDDVDLNAMADSVFKSMRDADNRILMMRVDTIKEQKTLPAAMKKDIDRIVDSIQKEQENRDQGK